MLGLVGLLILPIKLMRNRAKKQRAEQEAAAAGSQEDDTQA